MTKEQIKELYEDRVEHHEFFFFFELKEGTFEAYGHWSEDNEIDYDYFLNQDYLDGGRYKNEIWKEAYDYEWDLLIYDLLAYHLKFDIKHHGKILEVK